MTRPFQFRHPWVEASDLDCATATIPSTSSEDRHCCSNNIECRTKHTAIIIAAMVTRTSRVFVYCEIDTGTQSSLLVAHIECFCLKTKTDLGCCFTEKAPFLPAIMLPGRQDTTMASSLLSGGRESLRNCTHMFACMELEETTLTCLTHGMSCAPDEPHAGWNGHSSQAVRTLLGSLLDSNQRAAFGEPKHWPESPLMISFDARHSLMDADLLNGILGWKDP